MKTTIGPGQTVEFARQSISTPAGSTIDKVRVWGDCAMPD
jgi:hypothetical protein